MRSSDFQLMLSEAYAACLLGKVEVARRIVADIRSAGSIQDDPACATEVMLIEGVIELYSGKIDLARNRLIRVVAIGRHLNEVDKVPLALGWMALAAYNDGLVLESANLLAEAVESDAIFSPRVRLRLATTASNLATYACLGESSKRWNLASRIAAAEVGVPGVLSSVVFSMAVSSIDAAQLKNMHGELSSDEALATLQAVESAINYDAAAGQGVQTVLRKLALGMSLNLCLRYTEAGDVLSDYISAPEGSRECDAVCGLVELAYAYQGLSPSPLDNAIFERLLKSGSILEEPLERAAWCSVVAENYLRTGDGLNHQRFAGDKRDELAIRDELSAALSSSLARLNLLEPPAGWS